MQAGPEAAPAPSQPPVEEQGQKIADDVRRQLVAANVPQAQAEGRSILEAAFFETLAARGGGQLGLRKTSMLDMARSGSRRSLRRAPMCWNWRKSQTERS